MIRAKKIEPLNVGFFPMEDYVICLPENGFDPVRIELIPKDLEVEAYAKEK